MVTFLGEEETSDAAGSLPAPSAGAGKKSGTVSRPSAGGVHGGVNTGPSPVKRQSSPLKVAQVSDSIKQSWHDS